MPKPEKHITAAVTLPDKVIRSITVHEDEIGYYATYGKPSIKDNTQYSPDPLAPLIMAIFDMYDEFSEVEDIGTMYIGSVHGPVTVTDEIDGQLPLLNIGNRAGFTMTPSEMERMAMMLWHSAQQIRVDRASPQPAKDGWYEAISGVYFVNVKEKSARSINEMCDMRTLTWKPTSTDDPNPRAVDCLEGYSDGVIAWYVANCWLEPELSRDMVIDSISEGFGSVNSMSRDDLVREAMCLNGSPLDTRRRLEDSLRDWKGIGFSTPPTEKK
jgi:hypothetical protein